MSTGSTALEERSAAAVPAGNFAVPKVRLLSGAILGLFLYFLQNLAIWVGAASPGAALPIYHLRNQDSTQYIGFLMLAKDHLLFPNLHMPWHTDPAMLNVIFLVTGRVGGWLGLDPTLSFHLIQAILLMAAGIVLLWFLDLFLPTKAQRTGAILSALSAVPIPMFALVFLRFFVPAIAYLFWVGVIDLSYSTADGLLRGGLSNSPTLTFGASSLLLSLAFAGARLATGRKAFSWALAATVFLSAICHPFEVFAIVPSVVLTFLWVERKAVKELIPMLAAAGLGLAPHFYLMFRHPWLADLSQSFDTVANFPQMMLHYGLVFLAVLYLLLLRLWPRTPLDKLLVVSWTTITVISLIPGAPFPPHLLDGYGIVTGAVLVRLTRQATPLVQFFERRRRLCLGLAGCFLAVVAACYVSMFVQIAVDGRQVSAEYLISTVATPDEMGIVAAFKGRAGIEDQVLAPESLAMLLVRTPMHAFSSHQHLSLDYFKQQKEAAQFFDGTMSMSQAFATLAARGISWVVLPEDSKALQYFASRTPEFSSGKFRVFHLPENHLPPYPGLGVIHPDKPDSLVQRISRKFAQR
jgi:hypothetical protein